MRVAREFFERGILFLVKNDEARGLGGFGMAPHDDKVGLARARGGDPPRRALRVRQAAVGRRPYVGAIPDEGWAETLYGQHRPLPGGALALLPLLTNRETIALLYGDNPETGRALGRLEALEVFINQAGIALENAFLQRKVAGHADGAIAVRIAPPEGILCRTETTPPRRARSSSRSSSRPRNSPRSCSRRTSGSGSRSPAWSPEPGSSGGAAAEQRSTSCSRRLRELEERLAELEARYRKVEEENKEFADRYIEIEEQNNNLANLYVASYQLHSTLDYKEVIRIVQEIVINLIGAEAFHLFMVSDKTGRLELETSEGQTAPVTTIGLGEGPIGQGRQDGRELLRGQVAHREATPFDQPIAVIPLKIKDSVIGVISINKLLVQKTAFTTMDYELFTLLAGHAATAIFSAKLYSTSARKLTTLQGFLDMLKTPSKP